MKYSLLVGLVFGAIIGCGGGGSDDADENNGSGNDSNLPAKKLTLNSFTRHCGVEIPFATGEVVIHNDDGSIARHIDLDSSGTTVIESQEDTMNVSIIYQRVSYEGYSNTWIKTIYQLETENELDIEVRGDYSNTPSDCQCDDISMTLYGDTYDKEVTVSAPEYWDAIARNGNSEHTVTGVCAPQNQSIDILTLVTDVDNGDTAWAKSSYLMGSNDYLQFDPYENLVTNYFNMTTDADAEYVYLSSYDTSSDFWHSLWFNSVDSAKGFYAAELNELDTQQGHARKYLFSNQDTGHYKSVSYTIERDASLADMNLPLPAVNEFSATYLSGANQFSWSYSGNFEPLEFYASIYSDSGSINFSAPANMNTINAPQYPAEYNMDISSAYRINAYLFDYKNSSDYSEVSTGRVKQPQRRFERSTLKETVSY